ncbi:hypothetical protein R3I94_008453 [Phoxinus phoxinus]
MFRMKEPFESEKLQLQELNQRLGQYLMRSKQLEQENTGLISEINSIRQNRSGEWENKHMSELREMRRLVERLSFEKCRAEMERQKLRNELQMLQAMRSDEASVGKGIGTELKGCERQLHHTLQTNGALEDRLVELENEYKFLEDAHRKEIGQLRNQAHSRTVRVVTQTHHAPPAVTMEEVQEYAANFTESWQGTLDMYRLRVEEIEESIKADHARLEEDIQREKRECASQFKRLRDEIEKQTQVQLSLEEQLENMQEHFRDEISQYQAIIEELEYERRMLSNTISEKLKDHQDLVQVKMGLALEVAAYRALLEEEGRHAQMWSNQHSRERKIDIKMPSHPYTPRVSINSASRPDTRKKAFTGYDVKYMEPISSVRTSSTSSQFHSTHEPSRIVPISVSNRAQQSPVSRRDMISFTRAAQAAASSTLKPGASSVEIKREETDQRSMRKEVSQHSSKGSFDHPPYRIESISSSKASKIEKPKPANVISPLASLSKNTTEESKQKDVEPKEKRMDAKQDKEKPKATNKEERGDVKESIAKDVRVSENVGHKVFVGEEKVLDAISTEEIIQQVMKPAGLDTRVSSRSPDSKFTYHVEKTEQEDGSTKTQIVLQSKVEEELDLSEDSALEELLNRGVKKVTLENIKGTPTGTMIENLLSLGLQGESLGNRSVNVEIIEEPVESQSDEESEIEIEIEEIKSKQPNISPSSMFFQIEELGSDPKTMKPFDTGSAEASHYGNSGSVRVHEVTRDENIPYFSHVQESQEYFVSTPEDNMSEFEEGERFMSYSHYGVMDDLSDERYYQEDDLKQPTAEGKRYRDSPEYGDHSFLRDNIEDCIIEEEVHVSPTLQKSIVGILNKESLDPEQQLRGALEQIQDTVSGALKEELAFFTKGRETPENVSVEIKKVEQVTDSGSMTIVAELNVSQTLEESGLLEADLSEEQIMAALSSSHPALQQALGGGAGAGYTMNISQEEFQVEGMPWMTSNEEIQQWSSTDEVGKTEKHIKLGPSEKSITFQMDVNNDSSASTSGGAVKVQRSGSATEYSQTQKIDPHLKVCHEKRIATVYLESPKDE